MSYGHSIKRRFAFFFSGKPKNDEVLLVKHWTENQHQHEFELQIFFIYLGLPICNISIRKPLEATWSIFGGRHESNDSIERVQDFLCKTLPRCSNLENRIGAVPVPSVDARIWDWGRKSSFGRHRCPASVGDKQENWTGPKFYHCWRWESWNIDVKSIRCFFLVESSMVSKGRIWKWNI